MELGEGGDPWSSICGEDEINGIAGPPTPLPLKVGGIMVEASGTWSWPWSTSGSTAILGFRRKSRPAETIPTEWILRFVGFLKKNRGGGAKLGFLVLEGEEVGKEVDPIPGIRMCPLASRWVSGALQKTWAVPSKTVAWVLLKTQQRQEHVLWTQHALHMSPIANVELLFCNDH